jgi:hypothetical protein
MALAVHHRGLHHGWGLCHRSVSLLTRLLHY